MTQHIGIVGCSAEGAALCYRTICLEGAKRLGPHAHPEVGMHTHSLADYVERIERGDWEAVGALMLSSAEKLARAGADFLVCPDNTIHQALPLIEARSPLPWLHIVDAVGEQALARGYRKLGLLGTRWLVESEVYPEKLSALGIESVRPTLEQREDINRLIMDELVAGVVNAETVPRFQSVIQTLAAEGCDAVVLGCTEIPLVISHENSRLPTLDSTRLLARAALARAIGPMSGPDEEPN